MTMKSGSGALVTLGLAISLLCAPPAGAAFHLWELREVFSNEDGTIQFIELSNAFINEEFVAGTYIRVLDDMDDPLDQYDITTNLASGSTDKTFLLGTQALADLPGGVTPDYVIPAGFIDVLDASTIQFGQGVTIWSFFDLDGLPLDGLNSLDEVGGTAEATPTNYAGEVGTVPEPSAVLGQAAALFSVLLLVRASARKEHSGPAD